VDLVSGNETFMSSRPVREGSSSNDGTCERLHRIGLVITKHSSNDLDYDIFPIDDPSYHVPNRMSLPRKFGESPRHICIKSIASKIVDGDVWVAAGKSGVIKGTIIRNPYFIKMAGSSNYQKMWPVELDKNIGKLL
jgi:hypothetical protein